jgi:amino acid adenylation domain-containing protein
LKKYDLQLILEKIMEKVLSQPDVQKHLDNENVFIKNYNNTNMNIPIKTLDALFVEQSERTPQNNAIISGGGKITYSELNYKSNQVASYLKNKRIGKGCRVGVFDTRSVAAIVNIFGILKAGAAYVPVSPKYPQARIDYILGNSDCKLVLDDETFEAENMGQYPKEFQNNHNDPQDTAYIIFTSGSSGTPKGVVISHCAAANTVQDINKRFGVNASDKVLMVSSLCFDLSVYDIFGTLGIGATLIIAEDQRDGKMLLDIVGKYGITVWNSVPAIMDLALSSVDKNFFNRNLRLVLLSGDWIPLYLPGKIREHFESPAIISLGGATEASIWSIYYPIKEIDPLWRSIPYGYPLANQSFYVLDDKLKICPADVEGELYIGGVGIAKEYVNDEQKTTASFINHPEFGRIYKTGDFGVFRKKGYIEFLGRKDSQVKIQGYRIECGEIEKQLSQYPTVENCVVLDKTDNTGQKYLTAYYISKEKIAQQQLREFLLKSLPGYMIPKYFVRLDQFVLSDNGKVDRNALSGIADDPEIVRNDFKAPASAVEKIIAAIWSDVLSVDVSMTDNYYQLGGDSLKFVLIVQQLNEQFGLTLNVNDIINYENINELVEYINSLKITIKSDRRKNMVANYNAVVLLKKGTSKYPLFFAHAGNGNIFLYKQLVSKLDDSLTVYGIRAYGSEGGEEIQYHELKDYAAQYVEQLIETQPAGPVFMAGHCAGSTIIHEMANRLQNNYSREIGFLGFFDAANPQMKLSFPDSAVFLSNFFSMTFKVNIPVESIRSAGTLEFDQLDFCVDFAQEKGLIEKKLNKDYFHRLITMAHIIAKSVANHVPGKVKAKIVYYRSEKDKTPLPFNPDTWKDFVEGIEAVQCIGGHHDMLVTYAEDFAAKMMPYLKPAL